MAIDARMLIARRQGDRWVFRAHVDTSRVIERQIEHIDPYGDGAPVVVGTVRDCDPDAVIQREYMVPEIEDGEDDETYAERLRAAEAEAKARFAVEVRRLQARLRASSAEAIDVGDMELTL